jgi:hypothetical protein
MGSQGNAIERCTDDISRVNTLGIFITAMHEKPGGGERILDLYLSPIINNNQFIDVIHHDMSSFLD